MGTKELLKLMLQITVLEVVFYITEITIILKNATTEYIYIYICLFVLFLSSVPVY
jgi:hypothetical protein